MKLPIGTKKSRTDRPVQRRNGLTLIELTLVTLILLALVGLSIPIFKKTFSDLSAKNTSFNISKLINYAQEMAVLEGKNFKIVFNFQKSTYQLFELDASVNPPAYKKIQGRFGKLFKLPQGVNITGTKAQMCLYSDGHCDDLKLNVLVKGRGYSITVQRFGNTADIKEVNVES